jgi:hypothetical protein
MTTTQTSTPRRPRRTGSATTMPTPEAPGAPRRGSFPPPPEPAPRAPTRPASKHPATTHSFAWTLLDALTDRFELQVAGESRPLARFTVGGLAFPSATLEVAERHLLFTATGGGQPTGGDYRRHHRHGRRRVRVAAAGPPRHPATGGRRPPSVAQERPMASALHLHRPVRQPAAAVAPRRPWVRLRSQRPAGAASGRSGRPCAAARPRVVLADQQRHCSRAWASCNALKTPKGPPFISPDGPSRHGCATSRRRGLCCNLGDLASFCSNRRHEHRKATGSHRGCPAHMQYEI